MKLVKYLPMVVLGMLTACSRPTMQPLDGSMDDKFILAESLPKTQRTVVYSCTGKRLEVKYTFSGNEPTSADVKLKNVSVVENLVRDFSYKDSVTFIAGEYMLNVDYPLTLQFAFDRDVINFVKNSEESSDILAKYCSIDQKATKRLNKSI